MSIIPALISPQAFEVVRDRIGEILADELPNQAVLDSNNPDLNPTVYLERFIPFDKTEMPAVNVMMARGAFDGHTAAHTDGTYNYYIDVYHSSKSGESDPGDSRAMVKLHRLLGLCRAILEEPRYKTLGYAGAFIMHRRCTEIVIADPGKTQDAISAVMGRLTFSVRVPEPAVLKVPNLVAGYETTVKLFTTEKGYLYSS